MKTIIESIPHNLQRYDTVGDWFFVNDTLVIRVSELKEPRHMFLVALHELWEAILCNDRGITQEMVDIFDKDFEAHRHPDNLDEPGDSPNAPYRHEHSSATGIERLLAAELHVDWSTYEGELNSLVYNPS